MCARHIFALGSCKPFEYEFSIQLLLLFDIVSSLLKWDFCNWDQRMFWIAVWVINYYGWWWCKTILEAVRITPQLAQCIPSAQAYAVSKIRNSVLIATAMSWCWNIFCRLYGEIKVFFRQIIHLRDSFSLIEQRLPHTIWASKWNTMPCANVYLQNKFHDPQDLHLFPMSSLLSNYNEILI